MVFPGHQGPRGRDIPDENFMQVALFSVVLDTEWPGCLQGVAYCESADPLQGSKSPKSGKEGFGVKNLPCPILSDPNRSDFEITNR